jgi:beta-N-acetylglucosaminidase
MLENTFMASGNEYGIDYAELIHEAGQAADISPFFIAAKIIQEMGPQGQSLLAHGELPDYEGIYNFYNIGATPNPEVENGALINGARFASLGKDPSTEELDDEEKRWLIPWNSPERAITGGAIWIADRYVAIGQDTLYGQKFDLIADPDYSYASTLRIFRWLGLKGAEHIEHTTILSFCQNHSFLKYLYLLICRRKLLNGLDQIY